MFQPEMATTAARNVFVLVDQRNTEKPCCSRCAHHAVGVILVADAGAKGDAALPLLPRPWVLLLLLWG